VVVLHCLACFKRWSVVDLRTALCFSICKLGSTARDLLWILSLVVGESSCLEGIFTERLVRPQDCGIVYGSSK